MNAENPEAGRRAASRLVRSQPRLFAEAVAWVGSLRKQKRVSRITVGASADFRDIEGLILHYRAALDAAPKGVTATAKDAYRVILASWLLSKDGHRVEPDPGRKQPWLVRPAALAKLPLLTGPELRVLRGRYALESDPRWHRLLVTAWKLVDQDCLDTSADIGPPKPVKVAAKEPASPHGSMPAYVARARESYDWARKHASHLFGEGSGKFPSKAFEFMKDPKNGCPAYSGSRPPDGSASWARYVRLSEKWKPLNE